MNKILTKTLLKGLKCNFDLNKQNICGPNLNYGHFLLNWKKFVNEINPFFFYFTRDQCR